MVEYRLNRTDEAFQELNKKSASLKRILSRIPDEISDRKKFLETIKWVIELIGFCCCCQLIKYFISFLIFAREIASAIKRLLDAVNEAAPFIPGTSGKQAVEQRKKEFVKYSKKFSTTLKEYFKEAQ